LHESILARFDEKRPDTLADPSEVWVENTPPPATLLVMSRLFLAVWPTANVVEMLTELPRKDQQGVRFVAPENWHATLRFLGEADIDDVCEAMNRAELPAAVARVGPAIDMLGTHSAMAPVSGIDPLSAAVVEATAGLGSLDPRPTFTGHITIARVKRGAIVRKVVGMLCQAEFDVDEVALVESRLHPDGARYATVATWPTR
jgi:2'-5' RNA ligase|tara:strand:- start:668 stop:1273 length:606 start_codon:yes stop_codon:yes gene_type:complete